MRVRKALVLLVSALIAALLVLHHTTSDPTQPTNGAESERTDTWNQQDHSTPEQRALTTSSDAPGAPLPMPPGGALPDLWDNLAPKARRGDAIAACQLASATVRCAFEASTRSVDIGTSGGPLMALRRRVLDPTGAVETIGDPSRVSADTRARLDAERQRCPMPSAEQLSEARRLLRGAALAGVPDAQSIYALGELWAFWGEGFNDPVFDAWRNEAPSLLQRMLGEGHPDAPAILAQAYGSNQLISGLFEPDAVREAAYASLAERLAGRRLDLAGRFPLLTPRDVAKALDMAERLHARHYAGRRIENPAHYALPAYKHYGLPKSPGLCETPSTEPVP